MQSVGSLIDRPEFRNDAPGLPMRRGARPRMIEARDDQIVASLSLRNLVVDGRRTSVRLEPLLWDALLDIARRREMTVHELATEIATQRTLSNLTAAIRVYIVAFYRSAANRDIGIPVAGRGKLRSRF